MASKAMREELRRPITIHVRSDKRSARCRNASRTSCTHSPRERLTEGSDGRNTLARALSTGCDTRARAERALNGRTGRACLGVAGSCTLVVRLVSERERRADRGWGAQPHVRRAVHLAYLRYGGQLSGGGIRSSRTYRVDRKRLRPRRLPRLAHRAPRQRMQCFNGGEPERLGRTFASRFDANRMHKYHQIWLERLAAKARHGLPP